MKHAQWFVAKNGARQGPYSTAQMQGMAAAGVVQPADMILAHGATRWQPTCEIPDLFPPELPAPAPARAADEPPPLPPELARPDYFIAVAGQRHGPFTLAQLPAQGLRPETPVWTQGTPQWVRADQMPEVNALLSGAAPTGPTGGRPWNPVAVAWLGLLFSPVWCGIMAAVNAHRLRLDTSRWRPVCIGVGSLALALLLGVWVDWYLLNLGLYLGAVGLVAGIDLLPQKGSYLRYVGEGRATGGWVAPSLAGRPATAAPRATPGGSGEMDAEPSSTTPPEPRVSAELRVLVRSAQGGNPAALPHIKRILDEHPEVWRHVGDLAALAERAWIAALAADHPVAVESMKRTVAEMKADLAGDHPTRVEGLLVDQVVACWMEVSYLETAAADAGRSSLEQADFRLKRLESAQRRYMNAVKTLTSVQALARPGLAPTPAIKLHDPAKQRA